MPLLDKLHTAIRRPRFAALHINRIFSGAVLTRFRSPTDVFEEDWDNLLILDACRYDMLAEHDLQGGTLEHRWSGGSKSFEFLEYHLSDRVLDDVVWVTANPWVSRFQDSVFEVIDVWDSGWDETLQTVRPETLADAATDAAAEHPNKRIVVHFMQPHYPFIGEFGRNELPDHRTFTGDGLIEQDGDVGSVWDQLEAGHPELTTESVWRAYRENLDVVLPVALDLQRELEGKTVLTSDHGNEIGGRGFPIPVRLYGHSGGLRTKNLTKVPWVVFESEERRGIESGELTSDKGASSETVEDRLAALGYTE